MTKNKSQWFSMAVFNNKSILGFLEPLLQVLFPSFSSGRFRVKLVTIRHENTEVYTLRLKVGKRWKGFNAGQYIELIIEQNGAKISRFFSISSSPKLYESEGIIEVTIQKQNQGRITPWLCHYLKSGNYINISAAMGDFCLKKKGKSILLIAAGSGITPFKSMLGESINGPEIHLIYYAKSSKHIFVEELNAFEKSNKNISVSLIDSTKEGRLNNAQLIKHCPDFQSRSIYICGPGSMIESTKDLLLKNKTALSNINLEYFGAKPVENFDRKIDGIVSFKNSELQVKTVKNTLLELAESSGLKPLTGCRMGVCHQCICRKTQGVVYNTLNNSYSDTGAEDIQLCVSVPVGNVSINL